MIENHPYGIRKWRRSRLPWFFINIGVAGKGENCELVNAKHHWYNKDGKSSGCYYCKVEADGKKWINQHD